MKKSSWLAMLLMLVAIGAIYFFVFNEEQKKIDDKRDQVRIADSEGLYKIDVKTTQSEFTLELLEMKWWVVSPVKYPAKADFMERSLTVMNQVLADAVFDLKEDEYGFSKEESVLNLHYAKGETKTLVLGTQSGVGSQIYILNRQNKKVYVIHNVWGQLFYFEMNDLLSNSLPISDWEFTEIELLEQGKKQWSLKREKDNWIYDKEGNQQTLTQTKLIWWLRGIKEWQLKPTQFGKENYSEPWYELKIKARQGETSYFFNKEADEIYLKSLKAIAHIDPFSLKSLSTELEKVLKSAN